MVLVAWGPFPGVEASVIATWGQTQNHLQSPRFREEKEVGFTMRE